MAAEPDPRWEQLGSAAGLCRTCRYARLLASARSTFLRCDLSDTDPRFTRYPPLPVSDCPGWTPEEHRA